MEYALDALSILSLRFRGREGAAKGARLVNSFNSLFEIQGGDVGPNPPRSALRLSILSLRFTILHYLELDEGHGADFQFSL